MEIVRNADGSLAVPVPEPRHHGGDEDAEPTEVHAAPTPLVIHPGEGGYDAALAEWDAQQNPDRPAVVSTARGREEAMHSVEGFATEMAEAEGGDPLPAHQATKIIGEVLAELD